MAEDDNKLFSDRELLEQGMLALVRAAVEQAKHQPGSLATVIAVFGPLMALAAARGAYRIFADRTADLTKGYLKAFDNDEDKAKANHEERKDDPNYHDVMYRAFRLLQDAVDPAVVETLGYLAGQYNQSGRKADGYFRALGRILCDMEASELDELRRLIAGILRYRSEVTGPIAAVAIEQYMGSNNQVEERVRVASPTAQLWVDHVPSAIRLFGLLRREGLAQDQGPAQGMRRELGDNAIRIPFETVETIRQTIEPRT